MAKVRNISGSDLEVIHLGVTVKAGDVVEVPDDDVLDVGADHNASDRVTARNWRVPGVWAVEGDPPPVPVKNTPPVEPAPADDAA